MNSRKNTHWLDSRVVVTLLSALFAIACGGNDPAPNGVSGSGGYGSATCQSDPSCQLPDGGGVGGTSGAAGTSGTGGVSGTGGFASGSGTGGTSGTAGTDAGTGGTSGAAGQAGADGGAGTAGQGGFAGSSGASGSSGQGGSSGVSGSGGTSGVGGTAGTSGTGGNSGTGGTSGSGGVSGLGHSDWWLTLAEQRVHRALQEPPGPEEPQEPTAVLVQPVQLERPVRAVWLVRVAPEGLAEAPGPMVVLVPVVRLERAEAPAQVVRGVRPLSHSPAEPGPDRASFDALKLSTPSWKTDLAQGSYDVSLVGGVWGTSSSNIYVTTATYDFGQIAHWNGSSWSQEDLPGAAKVAGIWGSGPNDIWVAATGDGNLGYIGAQVFHNTGGSWVADSPRPYAWEYTTSGE